MVDDFGWTLFLGIGFCLALGTMILLLRWAEHKELIEREQQDMKRFLEPIEEQPITFCCICGEPLFDGDEVIRNEEGYNCFECDWEELNKRKELLDSDNFITDEW